jgi:hypothetical protein
MSRSSKKRKREKEDKQRKAAYQRIQDEARQAIDLASQTNPTGQQAKTRDSGKGKQDRRDWIIKVLGLGAITGWISWIGLPKTIDHFKTKISIEPLEGPQPGGVLADEFKIQNNSTFSLRDIQVHVEVIDLTYEGGGGFANAGFTDFGAKIPFLSATGDGSESHALKLSQLVALPAPTALLSGDIVVVVAYSGLFGRKGVHRSRFKSGLRDGKQAWLPTSLGAPK